MHKNTFGHVLVVAGSPRMIGAAALTGLAAMRSGAGLVTLGIPKSLNLTAQKKISSVIMTLPLPETPQKTLSTAAFAVLRKNITQYQVLVVGPGLSRNPATQRLILKIIEKLEIPMVIDADGLNALSGHLGVLKKNFAVKILTPHPGEMARLISSRKKISEAGRKKIALDFARKNRCVLLLKGEKTVVASPQGKTYVNRTGNAGMATAGSGDVLTGMIAALLAQGLPGFKAAQWGAFFHGKAGNLAARAKGKAAMIATDIIDQIPKALKKT